MTSFDEAYERALAERKARRFMLPNIRIRIGAFSYVPAWWRNVPMNAVRLDTILSNRKR